MFNVIHKIICNHYISYLLTHITNHCMPCGGCWVVDSWWEGSEILSILRGIVWVCIDINSISTLFPPQVSTRVLHELLHECSLTSWSTSTDTRGTVAYVTLHHGDDAYSDDVLSPSMVRYIYYASSPFELINLWPDGPYMNIRSHSFRIDHILTAVCVCVDQL